MALRTWICLVLALAACKDKGAATELDKRCEQLAKACGDTDKHVDKLVTECKAAAQKQATCTDKVTAAYDCFEKNLCGSGEKVWALDDLRVLAERHNKCVAEQKASSECAAK